MKLTRVEAASMQEALWKIRSTLGSDALIVGTRTFRRGGVLGLGGREVVEVYVADTKSRAENIKHHTGARQGENEPAPGGEEQTLNRSPSGDVESLTQALGNLRQDIQHLVAKQEQEVFSHPFLKDAYELLISHDVDKKLAERMVWELKSARLPVGIVKHDRVRAVVRAQVRKLFPPNLPTGIDSKNKVVVLIGPTGVGKTTTVAKVAARAKINSGKKVGLVTLDTFRIAAVDQLQKYAGIIGTPLTVVSDPIEFQSSVKHLRKEGMDLILVDTAGRGQRDELKMHELREFLSVVPDAEIHLVLSTTTHPRTLKNVVARFSPIGFHRLILTKLDESESFGSLVSVLTSTGKPVSYITDGQNVPDDIMISDPDRLADLVFRTGPV